MTATDDDLIRAIYAIVTRDDAVAQMLAALARRFACGSAALFYVHPRRPETTITAAYGPLNEPEVQARYRREFAALDPAPSAIRHLSVGEVATTDEMFKDTLPLYHRFLDGFYYPLGLRGALAGPITDAAGHVGIVAVHRGAARAPFDQDDIALLRRLTPHIAQALALRERFFALERRADMLEMAFEPLSFGLMLFDGGRLSDANAAARAILARGDGLLLDRQGVLTSQDGASAERLKTLFRTGDAGLMSVGRTGGGAYILRIYGFARRSGSRSAILVGDTEEMPADPAPLLKEIYGMPAQAARLVAALLHGGSLESYAAEAGLSRNTAKFHLKAAFAATGARRQADLMRRVAPMVRALAGI